MTKSAIRMLVAALLPLVWWTSPSVAGEVRVVGVESHCSQDRCRFDVTLAHEDEGWDHYANRWQIVDSDGQVLGTRVLHHPHVNEQPFTRSLSGVKIDPSVRRVFMVGRDSVHGDSAPFAVTLPAR